jgi:SAM-dependent methyltransferase
VDATSRSNRAAWEAAATKYVRESDQILEAFGREGSLQPVELAALRPVLESGPDVVHLQSGHGLDDLHLLELGASAVIGVDFSSVTALAAHARAGSKRCHYVIGFVPDVPLMDQCADLVYTGKGALIWLPDLDAWAREVHRLLRPGGLLYLYEAHPCFSLWSWHPDVATVRQDRSYFDATHVVDSFPGHGAVEFQHTVADLVNAVLKAGLELIDLQEHPEPFWSPAGVAAAAWRGRLPNSVSLLARRP